MATNQLVTWRVVAGHFVRSRDNKPIGIVRDNTCAPDTFFWASQHPFFSTRGVKEDDIAVPAELIRKTEGPLRLSIMRDEFLALPQRWQVERQGYQVASPPISAASETSLRPHRTVLSLYEEGIQEMAGIERMRMELVERNGAIPSEMEELFAEYRKAVRDRHLRKISHQTADMMGVHHGS